MKFDKLLGLTLMCSMFASIFGYADDVAVKKDYSNNWAVKEIESAIERGYVYGYENGDFCPEKNITRAEFVSMVNRVFHYTEVGEINFSDVPKNTWYAKEIAVGVRAGYIAGVSKTRFAPNELLTREQVAVILSKLQHLESVSENNKSFQDFDKISAWAQNAVAECVNVGLLSGYPDNTFRATQPLTRAEAVSIVERLSNRMKEDTKTDLNTKDNIHKKEERSEKKQEEKTNSGSNSSSSSMGNTLKRPEHNRILLEKMPEPDENIFIPRFDLRFTDAEVIGVGKWETEDVKFKPNTDYTVVFQLTTKEGYTLKGLPTDFFHLGSSAKQVSFQESTSELRATFSTGSIFHTENFSAKITADGDVVIERYQGNQKNVVIPKKINGRDVVNFGWGTFQDNRTIESVTFEDEMKLISIFDHCFANCVSLKGTMNIPSGVKIIGEKAFNNCASLEQINFPDSVEELQWDIIRNCDNLKKVTFASKKPPAKVSASTFRDMNTAVVIEIPEDGDVDAYRTVFSAKGLPDVVQIIKKGEIVEVKDFVFQEENGALTIAVCNKDEEEVIVPSEHEGKKVVSIGKNAFADKKKMRTLVVSEGIQVIDERAFTGCKNLEKVTLPITLEKVGEYAFSGTNKLTEVEFLGKDIPNFGNRALNIGGSGTYKKSKIIIPHDAELFDYGRAIQTAGADSMILILKKSDTTSHDFRWIFKEDGSMSVHRFLGQDENVEIPDSYAGKSVTEIGKNCFILSKNVEHITLPSTIQKIGREAFENKGKLKEIDIPKSVTQIGYASFKGCSYGEGIKIIFHAKIAPEFVDKGVIIDWYTGEESDENPNAFEGISEKSEIIIDENDITEEELSAFTQYLIKNGGLSDKISVRKK